VKIYLNREPVNGPWGGGNKIIQTLSSALVADGHEVVYQLNTPNIDLIYCQDPRPNARGEWYQHIINYKNQFGTKVIQRVGDVGSHGKPELTELVKKTCALSDRVIFTSQWAQDYIGYKENNAVVVHNAPVSQFYEYRNNTNVSKIKLVTHHWSTNIRKGFELYRQLDNLISAMPRWEFTYVGSLPKNFVFSNTNYIPATGDNKKLGKIISDSTIYLTASEEEAGANHVLEGMAAGLPVVYHSNGGSVKEYAERFGAGFNDTQTMIDAISNVFNNYQLYKNRVMQYTDNIDTVCKKYLEIIYD